MMARMLTQSRLQEKQTYLATEEAQRTAKHISAAFRSIVQNPHKIEAHMSDPKGTVFVVPIWEKKRFRSREPVHPFKGEIMENPDFQDFQKLLADNGIQMDDIGRGSIQEYRNASEVQLRLRPTAQFNGTVKNTLPQKPRMDAVPYRFDDYFMEGTPPWGSCKTL